MIRTVLFFLFFWASVIVSSPIAIVFWLLDSLGVRNVRLVAGAFVRRWSRTILRALGVRAVVSGLGAIPKDERICYVANHQGDLDIVLILAYMPGCVGFITKSQAAWMPFLNLWIFAIGGVFINRRNIRSARGSIERGIRRIRSGAGMAIFPEGTRSRGPQMGPFRNGSFKLATRAEATIVPLAIQGTYKVWEERKKIVPSDVYLSVGEPIRTQGMSAEERKTLPELVRRRILCGLRKDSEGHM